MEQETEARIVVRSDPDQHGPYIGGGWRNLNPVSIVGEESVGHEQCAGGAGGDIYAIAGEPKNVAILDM